MQALVVIGGGFADLCVSFLDSNLGYLQNLPATGGAMRTPDETFFGQAWGFVTVPPNAKWAYLEVYAYRSRTDRNTDLILAKPYLGYARDSQTEMTPWVPGAPMIHGGNVSTYIANAAISYAQIEDAAIGTAKIAYAAVDTLKIAGNAVTIPVAAYTNPSASVVRSWVNWGDCVQVASVPSTDFAGSPVLLTAWVSIEGISEISGVNGAVIHLGRDGSPIRTARG